MSQSRPGKARDSIADFTWCLIAASWGWPVEEIAAQLMEVSSKARENGKAFAELTARNAGLAGERRRQQSKKLRRFGVGP